MRFSESSQISVSEKSIFGQFEVIFLNVEIFPRAGLVIPVGPFIEECFNEKLGPLAGLKKNCSFSCKSIDFGHFWLPRSTFKVDFVKVQAKFQKIFGGFPAGGC